MRTRIVEAHGNGFNWGKMLVGAFEPHEWEYKSQVPGVEGSVVRQQGWGPEHLFVMDLATGEGAIFRLGGLASADLRKHAVWVCVLFPAALEALYELYRQNPVDPVTFVDELPPVIETPNVIADFRGRRWPGIGAVLRMLEEWQDVDEPMVEAIGNTLAAFSHLDSQELARRVLHTVREVLEKEVDSGAGSDV